MTSRDFDELSANMNVPWDHAREDRVLASALGRLAGQAHRRKLGWEAALGVAILLVFWQAYRSAGGSPDDNKSAEKAPAIMIDQTPAQSALPGAADGGVRGTTGGVAGTGGFTTDRLRGSTGLGGNAGTS